ATSSTPQQRNLPDQVTGAEDVEDERLEGPGSRDLQIPFQHDVGPVARITLMEERLAGGQSNDLRSLGQSRQLLRSQLGEGIDRCQELDQVAHTVERYSWMNVRLAAPAPTAAATRRMDPCRTSPAAKIPGTEVSSMYGLRFRGQEGGGLPSVIRSGPVRMNPASLSSTTAFTKPLWGMAPMKMNRPVTACRTFSPVARSWTTIPVSCSSPSASSTSQAASTSQPGVASIWSTR